MSYKYFTRLGLALALVLTAFVGTAFADNSIDISTLTPEKLQQIQKIIAEPSTADTVKAVADAVTPERVSSYAELGKAVGQGLAATAKELGIAANTFSQTGIGKVALFLIVWKLALGNIVSGFLTTLLGVSWLIVVFTIWTRYFRHMCLIEATEVIETTKYEGDKAIPVKTTRVHNYEPDNEAVNVTRFLMFIALAIACIPGFILI